jgi:thiol:disulfide interchange protein
MGIAAGAQLGAAACRGGRVAVGALLALAFAWTVRASQPDIYPPSGQAQADLRAALVAASAAHKRVIVDFGGNWCTDCHVLDLYFHDQANRPLLDAGYVLVHVNIGRMDENVDIAARYQIPLRKGVPALALLDEHGKLLFSQTGGEFEDMRHMSSGAVTEFLTHWKPPST